MFGKPQWFRAKRFGWGLVPITWQGWGYTSAWLAAIVLPYLLLLERHQAWEATIWMTLGSGALAYDVRQILRAMRGTSAGLAKAGGPNADEDILYILDTPATSPVATRNYNLRLKQ
jgi:hypothetical protein